MYTLNNIRIFAIVERTTNFKLLIIMNLQEIKEAVDNYGRFNMLGNTVIEVVKGVITIKEVEKFNNNHICINEIIYPFSLGFIDEKIKALLPCLNVMIEQSKIYDLLTYEKI